MKNKILGATLLITGTTVGAGMLALPMISGMVGFATSFVILTIIWALMTYTGLLILEVNLSLPIKENSFSSMAKSTAGPIASLLTWISIALLLYSLTGAYISGDASLLSLLCHKLFNLTPPNWLMSILFTLIFGSIVWYSTHAVDKFNRLFLTIKGFFLITTMALLMPKIHLHYLMNKAQHSLQVWMMIPIFLTSFGYHTVIPSLTNYLGKKPKELKKAIILGTSIPFILYSLWLITTLGTIPQYGPKSFHMLNQHNSVAQLTLTIMQLGQNPWISFGVNCFANVAVITSFLGVSLGLFDFNADVFKIGETLPERLKTAAITFLPPLLFSMIYPHGFLLALSAAALFVTFLEIILPAWMAFKLRNSNQTQIYRVRGGNLLLCAVLFLGVISIITCLLKFL